MPVLPCSLQLFIAIVTARTRTQAFRTSLVLAGKHQNKELLLSIEDKRRLDISQLRTRLREAGLGVGQVRVSNTSIRVTQLSCLVPLCPLLLLLLLELVL